VVTSLYVEITTTATTTTTANDAAAATLKLYLHSKLNCGDKTSFMCVWQDKLETIRKAEMKTLEDTVKQLEEKLRKKRAENQPQAASTPFSLALPRSEHVSYAFWFLQMSAWMKTLKIFMCVRSYCCFIVHSVLN
jgi:uncharacterized protein involved in tolerance to divalent cations